ncbi:hypothetical protein JRQ81_010319 [Phrynocephalus forsythii]|uniref:Proteasome assembly chaperone 3 n=1 Tax=Phrynocephalus forsythii TaxID=171643 RepID=A0A9Q1ARF0_9SAUR|nr:hypothetical protein JRQ81_010319 [Phrynocephalus forsythii]
MAAKSILDSKRAEEVVRGIPTEVVCTAFGNTILVVVTQYGKMGTLVLLEPEVVPDNISKPLLSTKVLLGKDESFLHICAKRLVGSVSQEAGNKPILLAVTLKDRSIEAIQALQEVIQQCRVWSAKTFQSGLHEAGLGGVEETGLPVFGLAPAQADQARTPGTLPDVLRYDCYPLGLPRNILLRIYRAASACRHQWLRSWQKAGKVFNSVDPACQLTDPPSEGGFSQH